jgi:malonyl-CoA decarboxylase
MLSSQALPFSACHAFRRRTLFVSVTPVQRVLYNATTRTATGAIAPFVARDALGVGSVFDFEKRYHRHHQDTTKAVLSMAFHIDTRQQRSFSSSGRKSTTDEPAALQTLKELAYKLRHPDEIKDRHNFQAQASMRALAGHFAKLYQQLPLIQLKSDVPCPRRNILEFLSVQCTLSDPHEFAKAVDQPQQHEHHPEHQRSTATTATALETSSSNRLHDKSAPVYEDVLRCMLQHDAVQGMQCLVSIREDLRQWIPCLHATSETLADLAHHLKRFDDHIQRQILSIWFVPGLLEIRRITYQHTSAQIIEKIARYEAVHPISNLNDLRRRLGPERRVFALFHPTLPDEPLFVLYISLQDEIATSMEQIHRQEDAILQRKDTNPQVGSSRNPSSSPPSQPKVAVFYSISNLRPGLSGLGLAEYLIQQAVTLLKNDLSTSTLETFVTLSPLPGFRKWLEERVIHHNIPRSRGLDELPIIAAASPKELQAVADYFGCPPESNRVLKSALTKFIDSDKSKEPAPAGSSNNKDEVLLTHLRPILMRLAIHYLVYEKHRRKPLNKVARFHIGNGAILDRIHWGADIASKNGWRNSFGIMVTYRYDLSQLQENQARHERDNHIPLGDQVQSL